MTPSEENGSNIIKHEEIKVVGLNSVPELGSDLVLNEKVKTFLPGFKWWHMAREA